MDGREQQQGEDAELGQIQRALASVYTVERLLNRRAIGAVYQAAEIKPPRPVAIMVFPASLGLGPATAGFKEAARLAITLTHPNIVPVYRVGMRAGVPFFVAAKLVDGRTLLEIIESQGALQVPVILSALRAVAAALAFAHGKNAAHGALTPSSILVDHDGHVLVSELGITRAIEDAVAATTGKPNLHCPEDAAGGVATLGGDQYGFGGVALAMLTGALQATVDPRVADPLGTLSHVRSTRVALPDALVRTLQKALAADPAQRFPSAADLQAAIEAIPFSDADGREAMVTLGRLARGEAVPKLRALSQPRTEVRAAGATPAPTMKAPGAAAPQAPAARPAAAAPRAPAPPPAAAPPPPKPAPAAAEVTVARSAVRAPEAVTPPAPVPRATPAPLPQPPRAAAAPQMPAAREEATAPDGGRFRLPSSPAIQAPDERTEVKPAIPVARPPRPTPPRPVMPLLMVEPERRGRRGLLLALGAVVVVAAAAGAAYLWLKRVRPAATPTAQAPAQAPAPSAPAAAAPAAPAAAAPESGAARTAAGAAGQTGVLMLDAVPSTAFIYLDGNQAGRRGSLDSAVAVGRRHLEVMAAGYEAFDTVVVVKPGDTVDLGGIPLRRSDAGIAAPAAAADTTGRLQLSVDPAAAEIYVDGLRVGTGSLDNLEIGAGQRQVQIRATGYATFDTLIVVNPGATVQLGQITLKTTPGGP